VPAVLIEYKAPHKLPLAEIIAGLSGEIRPAEDVINKDGDELEFLSKSLLAAVITQLFSSMIGKGVQRGYIFTGEATIFLYIPDDPTTVQYHLSIPSLDVQDSDRNRLHRTAVAQITAFILNAFAAEPPSQSWHDAAAYLDTWAVEYIDILKKIPETVRKASRHSSYRPSNWKGFTRSPIRTRAQTRHLASACRDNVDDQVHSSSDEDNDNEDPPSPTPNKTDRAVKQGRTTSAQPGARSGFGRKSANEQDNIEVTSKPRIEDRPYCTHQCLLGLASGGVLDHSCPNLTDHSGQHLQQEHFLRLVRVQLANDRGRDADCKPLFVKGSRGALVKIRLSSHGYTFVAKAMRADDRQHLLNEAKIYSRLKTLQGHHVPVYLGILDLELPIYYDYGIYVSMLLLSWAGRSLHLHLNQDNATRVLESVSETLTALHKRRVLHKDPELRNWLWDEQRGSIMLIDFERASVRDRPPLNVLSPNRKRNRQGELKGVGEDDAFDREMQIVRNCVARYTR
jgi:tRNA A-37 threonylcarbamoyl transferase component Bud32